MSDNFINCVFPAGCKSIGIYRGLCMRHYRRLQQDVRYGRTTWAEAEAAGRCAAQKRGKDGYTPATRRAQKEQP